MPIRLEQISGMLPPERTKNDGIPPYLNYNHGFNNAIETMSKRQIGLNRERLARFIFEKNQKDLYGNGALVWEVAIQMTTLSSIKGTALYDAYEMADAIIASLHELLEYKGEEK